MCSLFSMLIWPALSYNLRLLAWGIGLAAGTRIIFAVAEYLIGRQIDRKDGSTVSRELWLSSRLLAVITKMPRIRKFVHRMVPLFVIFLLGYATRDLQFYRDTDRFRIKVDRVDGPYRYWVHKNSETPWLLKVCDDIGDPGFDEGDWIDLTVLKTGPCMSLHQPYGFVAVPGHAKNRDITFKETR